MARLFSLLFGHTHGNTKITAFRPRDRGKLVGETRGNFDFCAINGGQYYCARGTRATANVSIV